MQDFSSRALKAKLHQDILKLDEELSVLSLEHSLNSASVVFRPEISLLQTQTEKQQLQQKIQIISMSTSGKESMLKAQLLEVQLKLQALNVKKQSELQRIKENKEKCVKEATELKMTLYRLEQEFSIASKSNKSRNKIQNTSKSINLKKYKETAEGLEAQLDEINRNKGELMSKYEKTSEAVQQIKEIISMTKEEMIQRYYTRAELIAECEQAEEMLEIFREDALESFDTRELADYFEGCKKIKAEQDEIVSNIKKINSQIDEFSQKLNEAQNTSKEAEAKISEYFSELLSRKEEEEVENLEALIRETCENLSLETLENVILSMNVYGNFDVDEEVLKIQLSKVGAEEKAIRDSWAAESSSIQELIRTASDQDNQKSRMISSLKSKYQEFFNKIAAITQWKNEVAAALNTSKPYSGPCKDQDVYTEFKNLSINHIEDPQSQKSFENIITLYIEKVSYREKIIQDNFKGYLKLVSQKTLAGALINSLKLSISSLQHKKTSHQISLTNSICKEKSLILFIKTLDPALISKVESLSKFISHLTNQTESLTESIESYLKPSLELSSESLKTSLKDLQNCKVILRDLSEEENNLTTHLERVLSKQHSYMLNSINDSPNESNLSVLINNIEETSSLLSESNKKLSSLDITLESITDSIEDEEKILNKKLHLLQTALANLSAEHKKLEDFEIRLHKINEAEAAPVPESGTDKNRAKSMNVIKGNVFESPKKSIEEDMVVSRNRVEGKAAKSPMPFKMFKPSQEEMIPGEKLILNKLLPLIKGSELYKRFSQRPSLKQEEFDPLDPSRNPPEACGFGLRLLKLSKCCSRVDVKQLIRGGFDSAIPIDSILKLIIPKITTDILKIQKKLCKGEIELSAKKKTKNSYEKMKESGLYDVTNKAFIDRCSSCKWFPFSIALNEGGRIELIANPYSTFKKWVDGLNVLIKQKKAVEKIRPRISSMHL